MAAQFVSVRQQTTWQIADPHGPTVFYFLCANMESEDALLKLVFNGDDFKGLYYKCVFHNELQITSVFNHFCSPS